MLLGNKRNVLNPKKLDFSGEKLKNGDILSFIKRLKN